MKESWLTAVSLCLASGVFLTWFGTLGGLINFNRQLPPWHERRLVWANQRPWSDILLFARLGLAATLIGALGLAFLIPMSDWLLWQLLWIPTLGLNLYVLCRPTVSRLVQNGPKESS